MSRPLRMFTGASSYTDLPKACCSPRLQQGGLPYAREAFADRVYDMDGQLLPRSMPGSVWTDKEQMVDQVSAIVQEGYVQARARDGSGTGRLPLQADTICLHGDGERAVEAAAYLRQALSRKGVQVQALHAGFGETS
ncbi:hypothetical protein XYCOK13_37740 [Xylanibacillus composti]|uniref:LamB/YcsF family protein n=1 Tax=Xylanibacillus composti TaxID=1572762 RepID=A0A8J4M3J9_9BACL|nr:hypothetical protein XYCOK13_37740 [Xylanibacillus composti]